MYITNSELNNVNKLSKKTENLQNKFITFINNYNLSHISYKFLPNLILNKILFALDVDNEIDRMEIKIQRINEVFQKKRDNKLNLVLTVLAIFGVFSVNWDLNQWFEKLGFSQNFLYPIGSFLILSIILFTLVITLVVLKKK